MGRPLHRLSPTKVRTVKRDGMYADGGGLYLQVKVAKDGNVNKSWLFRYAIPEKVDQRERKGEAERATDGPWLG